METNPFSEKIKYLRKINHISQKELGDVLGLSRTAITKIETGSSYATTENLILIANFFNVSIDYLLNRTDKPEINK